MTIVEAIKQHNLEVLIDILRNNSDEVNQKDENGLWVFFLAALEGNYEIIEYLVMYSFADLLRRDELGNHLLHYAVRSGSLEAVKYLVERVGMSPLVGNVNGITPYDLAVSCEYKEIQEYFAIRCNATYEEMYHNPILSGMYPDPSIVRVGEDYYMVNSSFIYFPCIPISHSKDLVHWEVIGHAITNPAYGYLDELDGGMGYWAPDISYYQGRFYITATYRMNNSSLVRRKQMITSSIEPQGPYEEPTFIEEDGIDPSLFTDDDGRRYMLLNRGAKIIEISKDGKEKLSESKLLWYGDRKVKPEGPHLLKKDGYYYLFLAEGGTGRGHQITVARSKDLMGPYDACPYNPILHQTDELASVQCSGHGKPVMTQNGQWYMVYLCSRPLEGKYSILGRETAMAPIIWTEDGWPIVNRTRVPSSLQKRPQDLLQNTSKDIGLDVTLINRCIESDNTYGFKKEDIALYWMTPREPLMDLSNQNITYGIYDNKLWINGQKEDLNSTACRSVLLRRQCDFVLDGICDLNVPELSEKQDLGLCCYYDENSYIKCGVSMVDGIYGIFLGEYIDSSYRCKAFVPRNDFTVGSSVEIKVEIEYLKRTFYYRVKDEEWILIQSIESTEYLSSEGLKKGKRFTAAMLGMYVNGPLTGVFHNFVYLPKN